MDELTRRRLLKAAALGIGAGAVMAAGFGAAPRPNENAKQASSSDPFALRKGTIIVNTRPGAAITSEQTSHEFRFGTALRPQYFVPTDDPWDSARNENYTSVVTGNFSAGVHEYSLKWEEMELVRDEPDYTDADLILAWCEANSIVMRGTCIFWEVEDYVPDWLKPLSTADMQAEVQRRGLEVTTRYRGRIPEYDLDNEMLDDNFYVNHLGASIHSDMFNWARQGDPAARLCLNDYNILNGTHLDAYCAQIEGLLAAGVPVGGIGCQGHFDAPISGDLIQTSLDRLAQYNLPIMITEFDILGDADPAAEFLWTLYRTAFAHPAVDGIFMWGFWHGAHWRPQAALWNDDWTMNQKGKTYHNLVRQEWWTRFSGAADKDGQCVIPAFFGVHNVTIDGSTQAVTLAKSAGTVTVTAS